MIKKLYDKCIEWAGYKNAKTFLAIESFSESSFFPVPPDVMIVPMVVAKRNEWIKIAFVASFFSTIGAFFAYFIGYFFFNEIGIKIFEFYGYESIDIFLEKFSTKFGYISWLGLLVAAGFTPIPFKVMSITSGFIHFNLFFFILVWIFTRSIRFFLVAYLAYRYGQSIGPFLEKRGIFFTVIMIAAIIILCILFYFYFFK